MQATGRSNPDQVDPNPKSMRRIVRRPLFAALGVMLRGAAVAQRRRARGRRWVLVANLPLWEGGLGQSLIRSCMSVLPTWGLVAPGARSLNCARSLGCASSLGCESGLNCESSLNCVGAGCWFRQLCGSWFREVRSSMYIMSLSLEERYTVSNTWKHVLLVLMERLGPCDL